MGIKEDVAEMLIDAKAVSVDTAKPYTYGNGMISPVFIDIRVLLSYPEKRKYLTKLLSNIIKDKGKDAEVLVAAGNTAVPFCAYLSKKLGLPMVFVRRKAKAHGKGAQIEGVLKEGQKAIVVTDILTTDPVLLEAIRATKRAGGDILFCLSVFDNNLQERYDALEEEGIDVWILADLKNLLPIALFKKYINDDEKESIEKWIADPNGWNDTRLKEIETKKVEFQRSIAKALLDIKAVTLSPKEPYTFSSGIRSPIYTDNRLFLSNPGEWDKVIEGMAFIIRDVIGVRNVQSIAGVASAGIPHASEVSSTLAMPMIYVKANEDSYGKRRVIEGEFNQNDKVVMIEDLISTGGSSLRAVERVRRLGGIVNHCISIFTYGLPIADENFEKEKVELHALTNLDVFLDVAIEEKYIKPEEKELILDWTRDSKGWGKKHGFE